MQKSYCYTPGVRVSVRVGVSVGVSVGVRMQNVRANVKVLEFKSFCIFSCILTLLIILIKPLTTKAYDRRASGDCGTSGSIYKYSRSTQVWDYYERLHLALKYSRVAVPFIIPTCPNTLLFLITQSFPSFQNKDMRIVAWVATKVTHGPALTSTTRVGVKGT